ncbi:isopeptide-forming domain-containing fimbrial protein [Mycetocola sp. JXN-3]|uniref:DUF7927 domain-containing protein n=1 Tax=Mycetocola sp. JXN-3 TaxID=2116510 RepID=UPI00165D03D4|nr:isopeptide-forming domain-containing fimbrial protein [Mycetocola sp. JXN-3]
MELSNTLGKASPWGRHKRKLRSSLAGMLSIVLVGSGLGLLPTGAMAATTTDNIVPFDDTLIERYTEVAQFGSDIAGTDPNRTAYDVKLDANTVVYTSKRGDRAPGSGSVIVRTWVGPAAGEFSTTTLTAPASAAGFGFSVDVDDAAGIVVVGARFSNTVYVYTRSGDTWSTTPTTITAADNPRIARVGSFGESVSLSDSHLVIGAPNSQVDGKVNAGSAFVVPIAEAISGDARAQALLLPAGRVNRDDVYGQTVAARDATAVVSAPQHRETAADGRDYQVGQISAWNLSDASNTFTVTPDVNQEKTDFPPNDEGGSWAGLGRSIVITADGRVIAGSPSEVHYTGEKAGDIATDSATTQGAVYVFTPNGTLAGQSLSALPGQYYFGSNLDFNEETRELFIGSLNLDAVPDRGNVQVFDLTDPASTTPAKPLETREGGETKFGSFGLLGGSVQASTGRDKNGAQHHRVAVSASGGVYVFESLNAVTLTKTTSLAPGNASPSANEGKNVATYTVSVTNTTGVDLTDFVVTDDLRNVLDDAEISAIRASIGSASLSGNALTWTGNLAVGETLTITYVATVEPVVTADDTGVQNYTEPVAALVNSVSTSRIIAGEPAAVPSVRVAEDAPDRSKWTDGVTVTTPIDGALKLNKTVTDADGNGRASAGERVSYSLTATNVGGLPLEAATVTDDLSSVLTYASAPENTVVTLMDREGKEITAPAAGFDTPILSWTGDIPAGAKLTIGYDVVMKSAGELYPLTGGEALVNGVDSPEKVDPEGPTTTLPVEDELILQKSAAPASGSEVRPGDQIVYTLTLTNKDAAVAKTGVTLTDDLSEVLAYTSLVGDPSNGAKIEGNTLTWTGDVAAGATVTITYTVTVSDSAPDGQKIGNHVTSAQVRENPPGTEHEVVNPRGTVSLSKASMPFTGTQVKPGDTITYTVTATNDTGLPITDVVIEDVVSGPVTVIESSLPAGAVLEGNTIRWTGTVPAQNSVVLSYRVTVDATATAPAVVGNVVTSDDMSNNPDEPPSTRHPVRTIELTKTSEPASGQVVKSGDVITYTLSATNPSAVDFANVEIVDNLADVLNNATLVTPLTGGLTLDSNAKTLTWTGDIAAGATITLSYQVTVNDVIEPEGAILRNVVSSPDSPRSPETTHPTKNDRGQITLAKSSVPTSGSIVRPGESVTYSVTATNATPRIIRDVRIVDDVSGLLGNARIETESLPAGMTLNGNELVWTGDIPGNTTVTLTYRVTVNADATAPAVLKNVVTSDDMTNVPTDPPTTEHPVGTVTLDKRVTPASGTAVKAGDRVTYAVTVTNPAATTITGVSITDNLAQILDQATLVDGPTGGASITGQTLTWNGDLAAGETKTFTYTVQVNAGVTSGALRNVVVSPDAPTEPETENPIGSVTLAKTVSVPAGTAAKRGEDVTYAVTIANTSGVDVLGATVSDDLRDVLDNATLVADSLNVTGGPAATITDGVLSWTGDVAHGATVVITYTVTVNDDAPAGAVLRNAVTSPVSPETPETITEIGLVSLAKTSSVSPAGAVKPGSEVTYTVTVKNSGSAAMKNVSVVDDLTDVLAHSTVTTEPTATAGRVTRTGNQLNWTGDVAAGAEIRITYAVTVNADVVSPATLRNVVTSPDSTDVPETINPIGTLELAKSTSVPAGSTLRIGDEVTYTVTITNNSDADMSGVQVVDDLSDVLDNADLVGSPAIVSGGGTLTRDDTRLIWTGDVAAGATVTLSYTVAVRDDVSGVQTLRNVVTSPDSPSKPETENPIGSVGLEKTSQPASGSAVKRGDTVTYTVTVNNYSGVDLTGVSAVDDLSGVLGAATPVGEPEIISGGGTAVLEQATATLTWTGDLAASQSAVIRYSVIVMDTAESGDVLRNLVSSPDSPGEPGTENPVATIGLTKSVVPKSGTAVRPGERVTYTVTAHNTTGFDVTNVSIADDLSDVLDDATLTPQDIKVSDGSTATLSGTTLIWAGTVPARGAITITYTVTVNTDAVAPSTLRNVVTSPHSTDKPETQNPVGTVLLSKINDRGDGTVVLPGEKVTYTVTIANPGAGDLAGVSAYDDLADVLNNATWNNDARASAGTVALDGNVMRWDGSIPAGGEVTVTYSVTVDKDAAAPDTIRNRVTSRDSTHVPSVENPVGTVGLKKTADPASGTAVKPGQTVGYTLSVSNPAQVDQENVRVTDNLSDVLTAADLVGTPVVSDGSSAAVDGNILNWIGTVPAKTTLTITYQVRVRDTAVAPATLRNLVTSPNSTDKPETEHPVGTVTLAKAANPASGSSVAPGKKVTYTVTITNPVDAPVSGVRVVDDLSDVLNAATLTTEPRADGGTVTYDPATRQVVWTGDLTAKQSVTLTYAVTVNKGVPEGTILRNHVTSPDSPDTPETVNPVGEVTTAKRLLDANGTVIPSGTVVAPGQSLTYELSVVNGSASAEQRALRDDLAGILGTATLTAPPIATWTDSSPVPAVSFVNNVIQWAGVVPAGTTLTIRYTVQTDPRADGTTVLNNTLWVDGTEGPGITNPVGTLALEKSVSPASGTAVTPGELVTYTITAGNQSDAPITGARITDDLSGVLTSATVVGKPVVSDGSSAVIGPDATLTWTGDIPARGELTITYTVRVNADAAAPAILRNLVLSPNSPQEPETVNPVGTVSLFKDSVPAAGTAVKPGSTVDYSVTIRNTTAVPIFEVSVTDDLGDVLDDATLVDGSVRVSDGTTATVVDGKIVWNGTVPAGSDITITYSVTVNADAEAPAVLRNVVTSPDSTDVPETVNPVGTLRLVKTSVPGSGIAVKPGDAVDYTVQIINDSTAPILGTSVSDDLATVLNNATLVGTPAATTGSIELSGSTMLWSGDVPAQTTITLTYRVLVNDDAVAPAVLRNVVTSPDSPSVPETVNPVATVKLNKSSNPTSGIAVKPGDTVTYTVTATNEGLVDLPGVYIEDNLSNVLNHASLVGTPEVSDGSQTQLNGASLTWTGTVPAGKTIAITYRVLIAANAVPPAVLRNVVSSPQSPEVPETMNPVGTVNLAKTSDPASGTTVGRGQTVNYTITVTNPTPNEIRGIVISDDLSGVLESANLVEGSLSPSDGSVTVINGTLGWEGTVPAGATVEIRYAVKVKASAVAPATLKNVVVSPHSIDKPGTENPVSPPDPGEKIPTTGSELIAQLAPITLILLVAGAVAMLIRQRSRRKGNDVA